MKLVFSRNEGTSIKKRKKKIYNNMKQMRVRSILLVECFGLVYLVMMNGMRQL